MKPVSPLSPAEFRAKRMALCANQFRAADAFRVTQPTLSRWERGRKPIPATAAALLLAWEAAGGIPGVPLPSPTSPRRKPSPEAVMTPAAFKAMRERHFPDMARAALLLQATYADLIMWEDGTAPVPRRVARRLQAEAGLIPRRKLRASHAASTVKPKFGVRTPKGDFPTIRAAAEHYSLSYHTAWTRATRGEQEWTLIPVEDVNV